MRRYLGALVAIAMAGAVVLPTTTSDASTISQTKLTSELLLTSQMPAGWTSSATTDDGIGCLHDLLEPSGVTQTHSAQTYFLGTVDELPKFDEKIATYSNAKTAYKKIIAHINACHTLSGVVNGVAVTGSVGPISFAHFGNASATYAMSLTDVRGTLPYDYLIVRKDKIVAAFLEGSYPSVVPSEFSALVSKGVAKLSK
jgi:hypothetical protein